MTKPWTFILVLLTFIYSCSDNTSNSDARSGITILTRGPRGSVYTDSAGKEFGFRVFRTQVVNDTIIPIELAINFPKDSIVLIPVDSIASLGIPKSDRYVKFFLFPRSMIPDKQKEAYNYGITGIDSFLNTGLSKPTTLKTIIQPKKGYVLYIGALVYPESQRARSTLFIKGQNLIYKIMFDPPLDSALIPCGQIVFKK